MSIKVFIKKVLNKLKNIFLNNFIVKSFILLFNNLRLWLDFKKDFKKFKFISKNNSDNRFVIDWKKREPHLKDKTKETAFEPHYTYHVAWAARVLAKYTPSKHIDISSSLNFATVVSAFIPIDFYDYRPANIYLNNLNCKSMNLLNLNFDDESIDSLSCMHVVEHVGLGRYGDTVDSDGDLKAIKELKRVLAKKASCFLSFQ